MSPVWVFWGCQCWRLNVWQIFKEASPCHWCWCGSSVCSHSDVLFWVLKRFFGIWLPCLWELTDFCIFFIFYSKPKTVFWSQWGRCLFQTQNAAIWVVCQNMVIVFTAESKSVWFPQWYFCLQFGCRRSQKVTFPLSLVGSFEPCHATNYSVVCCCVPMGSRWTFTPNADV